MAQKNPFKLEQVAVRLVKEPPIMSEEKVNSPESAIRLLAAAIKDYDREVLCVVNLKTDLTPINMSIVSIGGLNEAYANPREILKCAFLSNANAILLFHNHPSGNLTPSKSDVVLTDRMQKVCTMANVPILDHVIIGGEDNYYSFREKGLMPLKKVSYESDIEKFHLDTMGKVAEKVSIKDNLKSSQKKVIKDKVKIETKQIEKANKVEKVNKVER